MAKAFEVEKHSFDATRPWAVVATYRSFNRVIQRYEDESAAKRRARDLNRLARPLTHTFKIKF